MPSALPVQFDLLVLAELNPDVVVLDRTLDVRFGQVEQVVDSALLTLGSSGAITAAAAAARGLQVALCAVVGDDAAGAFAVDRLCAAGVDTSALITVPGAATGMTVVLGRAGGDRALLTFPGTMAELTADAVPEDLLARARHVHVSSFYLQTALRPGLPGLLTAVRARGGTVSLDPGWDPAEDWLSLLSLLGHVDFLLPNAAELAQLARVAERDSRDVAGHAAAIAAFGPAVVAKLGADGGMYADGDGVWRCAGDRIADDEIIDTTGAGDNFDAGFLVAMLGGSTPQSALAQAVVAGAISLRGRGGTGRMATSAEAMASARLRVVPVRTTDATDAAAVTAGRKEFR